MPQNYFSWLSARVLSIAFCLLLVVLGVRLAITVFQTETGLETLQGHWRATTVDWVAKETPLYAKTPGEQAEFWMEEVDRIVQSHAHDPDVLMGAATVLDSPCPTPATAQVWTPIGEVFSFTPRTLRPEMAMNYEWHFHVGYPDNDFELHCAKRCIELARLACEKGDSDENLFRLRAMLLCNARAKEDLLVPRTREWREELEACSKGDPENAYYDYLAAALEWKSEGHAVVVQKNNRLMIVDQPRFDAGQHAFALGQSKPLFAMGQRELQALDKFLRLSRVSSRERASILFSRILLPRRIKQFRLFWSFPNEVPLVDDENELAHYQEIQRHNQKLIEQYEAGDPLARLDPQVAHYRALGFGKRLWEPLPKEWRGRAFIYGPRSDAPAEIEISSKIDAKVANAATEALAVKDEARNAANFLNAQPLRFFCFLMVNVLCFWTLVCLILVVVAFLFRSSTATTLHPPLGWRAQVLVLSVSVLLSIGIFGMAPGQDIPRSLQRWLMTLIFVGSPLFVVWPTIWSLISRREFQFSLRNSILGITLVCILLGVLKSFSRPWDVFGRLPFDLYMPQGESMMTWVHVHRIELLNLTPVMSTLLHWLANGGPYWFLAFWVIGLLLASGWQCRKTLSEGMPYRMRLQRFNAIFAPAVARATWMFGGLALVGYLWFAPIAMHVVEEQYQWQVQFARNPQFQAERIRAAVVGIRADGGKMANFKADSELEARNQ